MLTENDIWLLFSAGLVGLGKGGLPGMAPVAVACFTMGVGTMRQLMGLLVCANLSGDLMAVRLYLKDVDWNVLFKVAAPCAVGVAVGAGIQDYVQDRQVKIGVGILLLFVCGYNSMQSGKKGATMSYPVICVLLVIGGVASLLANMMGPVVELAMLSIGVEKKQLIATSRILTVFTNISKLMIHVSQGGLKSDDLWLVGMLAVCAALTAPLAKIFINLISADVFNKATYFFIIVGALNLLRNGLSS